MLLPVFKRLTWRLPKPRKKLRRLTLALATIAAAFAPAYSQPNQQPPATATPIVITLQDAIKRAQTAEPNFANSVANARIAGLDKSIARAALLPTARVNGEGLYVQPNGLREVGG